MIFEYQGRKVFDGKTVEGLFQMFGGKTFITPHNCAVAKEVAPDTVRMFTGKRDRNGKKIYEYDVVRFFLDDTDDGYCESEYIVLWDDKRCGFYVYWTENKGEWDFLDTYFCENCEVIGNGMDVPELCGVYADEIHAAKSQALGNLIGNNLCKKSEVQQKSVKEGETDAG